MPSPQVSFSTVRPPDYSLPYSVLEGNGVAFGAVDKRGNWMLSVMVGHRVALAAARRGARGGGVGGVGEKAQRMVGRCSSCVVSPCMLRGGRSVFKSRQTKAHRQLLASPP
jgi:hypothetical protein